MTAMGDYLNAAVTTLARPLPLAALATIMILWVITLVRARRLAAIMAHLESLPPAKRLYDLERAHNIHPGPDSRPIPFVQRKRRRLIALAVGLTVAAIAGFAGAVVEEVLTGRAASVTLRELGVIPSGHGYLWRVALGNTGARTVVIDDLSLEILDKSRHPEANRPSPPDSPRPDLPVLELSPALDLVSVLFPDEEHAVHPASTRNLAFIVAADHEPRQGWIYDVRLRLKWHVVGHAIVRTETGAVYRLGWPGLLHWSESGGVNRVSAQTVVDPPAPQPQTSRSDP